MITTSDAASRRAETPLDTNNHALDALRYLIATIDERKLRRKPTLAADPEASNMEEKKEKKWLRYDN